MTHSSARGQQQSALREVHNRWESDRTKFDARKNCQGHGKIPSSFVAEPCAVNARSGFICQVRSSVQQSVRSLICSKVRRANQDSETRWKKETKRGVSVTDGEDFGPKAGFCRVACGTAHSSWML